MIVELIIGTVLRPAGGEGGGDAATLQGQSGGYYRDRANHTGTQSPVTITQDANNRFVSDAEKATWNGKQNALGFVPVATDDVRLSDARTPTAHTHVIEEVTGLSGEMAAKANIADLTPYTGPSLPADISGYPEGKVFIID